LDTPTHGLIGRLVARTIWPDKAQTGLVNVVTVCSVLPDLDVLLPGGGLDYLVSHRGMSHSFFGVGLMALVVAWIARKMGVQSRSFGHVYLASLLGFMTHIFFDLVTTFGTLVFAPLSNYRMAWDVLFIIDPYLDVLLIGGLLVGWLTRLGATGYRVGSGLVAGYVLAAFLITGIGHVQLRNWAGANDIVMDKLAVMPAPFSPLHRRGMVVSEGQVYWVPMALFGGIVGDAHLFDFALSDDRLTSLWDSRAGEIYSWFTRFPVVHLVDGPTKTLVVQDLQFMVVQDDDALGWLGTWAARLALDHNIDLANRRNFALEIELDDDGQIQKMTYLDQTGERYPL
jgi:inner membrane protein